MQLINKKIFMIAKLKFFLPIIYLFIALSLLIFLFSAIIKIPDVDSAVLMVANTFFLLLTLIVFLMQQKALKNINPNVFVRSVLGGVLIKMFACILAIFVYRFLFKNSFNKISVIIAMFFYLFYLATEVAVLLKMNKQKNA